MEYKGERMKKRVFISAIALASLIGCGGGATTTPSRINGTNDQNYSNTATDTLKQDFLDAINDARAHDQDCGTEGVFSATTALTWSDELYNATYEHSKDMAESNTFDHDGSNTDTDITATKNSLGRGSHPHERVKYNGYSYSITGENIAAGQTTLAQVIAGWIDSDGHCANLMNPQYKNAGMSYYKKDGSTYTHYWTQSFGAH